MENDIILWQQAATTLGDSILSHNGQQILPSDESYQGLFNLIFNDEENDILLHKSDNVQIYKRHNSYLIFAHCEEEDEKGRKIAFASKISAQDKSQIIQLLKKELSLSNKTISLEFVTILFVLLYKCEIIAIVSVLLLIICFTLIYKIK